MILYKEGVTLHVVSARPGGLGLEATADFAAVFTDDESEKALTDMVRVRILCSFHFRPRPGDAKVMSIACPGCRNWCLLRLGGRGLHS